MPKSSGEKVCAVVIKNNRLQIIVGCVQNTIADE